VAAVDQVDVDGGAGQDPDRVGEQVQLGWAGVGGQEPGQAAVVRALRASGVPSALRSLKSIERSVRQSVRPVFVSSATTN